MEQETDRLKDKLARACRILEMVGLFDYCGHISARLPGSETFYIHPLDVSRSEVTPDDMGLGQPLLSKEHREGLIVLHGKNK